MGKRGGQTRFCLLETLLQNAENEADKFRIRSVLGSYRTRERSAKKKQGRRQDNARFRSISLL